MPPDARGHGTWKVWPLADAASEQPPDGLGLLFSTGEWARVLEGLGCEVVFARHDQLEQRLVVPIFQRGLLRVAFMGFPTSGDRLSRLPASEFEALQRALAAALGCQLVRGVRSRVRDAGLGALPEVWIEDLRAWPGERGKRIQKDLAFAARAGAGKRLVTPFVDGDAAYALYERTVLEHRGRLRYTPEYFRRITALSERSHMLESAAMVDADNNVTAFAVMARDGDVAYYLHGAVRPGGKATGDGDVLLAHLIATAKRIGARNFSLMASPADQPGLVRYKKKWGETEGYTCTHDVGRGWLGRPAEFFLRCTAQRRNTQEAAT